MNAPPIPCTARASVSVSGDVASPHRIEATVKIDQADDEDAPAADAVGERAGGQQQRGERQRVGVDHPLQVGEVRVQVALDRRQRDVHDRDVEQEHEGRRADGDQRPPLRGPSSQTVRRRRPG